LCLQDLSRHGQYHRHWKVSWEPVVITMSKQISWCKQKQDGIIPLTMRSSRVSQLRKYSFL
jgi:hypothetical protein